MPTVHGHTIMEPCGSEILYQKTYQGYESFHMGTLPKSSSPSGRVALRTFLGACSRDYEASDGERSMRSVQSYSSVIVWEGLSLKKV
ncbi:hypothetical protein LHYA1_G006540, partial [Lachnellula hyalina]